MSDDDKTVIAGLASRAAPGMRLNGIYQIDQLVGTGGMSEIYRGHNVQTYETVAIKVILPQFAHDEQIVSLFRREALILNRLNHEAIVRYHVFSHDPAIDLLYLAMEYVEGATLRERIAQRPLSQMEACQLIAKVAAGMRVAHREGVVHRDLSSDNIILVKGDVSNPKVIDFGIARAGDANDATLIETGFAGKYNYVSPEQLGLFGGQVGPAADIYSLGLVFAAALRGKPLDMSGTHADVVMKRQSVPDLSNFNPGVKPLIERMLQPNPAHRLKSMDEVIAGLDEILGPKRVREPGTSHPRLAGSPAYYAQQGAPHRSRWPLVLLALLGATALGSWGAVRAGLVDPDQVLARFNGAAKTPPEVETVSVPDDGSKSQIRAPAVEGEEPAAATIDPPKQETVAAEPLPEQAAQQPQEQAPAPAPGPQPDAQPEAPRQAQPIEQPEASPEPDRPRISLNEGGSTPPTQGGAAPAAAAPSLATWLRDFDGGECFYVRPISGGTGIASIEGFTRTVKPLEQMDKDFRTSFGREPSIRMRPIEKGQCSALQLVEAASGQMRLHMDRDLIRDGETISANISNISFQHVAIFMVSPNGATTNVTAKAKPEGRQVILTLPASEVSADKQGYLMLAVSADKPLKALDGSKRRTADQLVEELDAEARNEEASLDASLIYFRRQ